MPQSIKVGLCDSEHSHIREAIRTLDAGCYSGETTINLHTTLFAADKFLMQLHSLDVKPTMDGREGVSEFWR